MRVRRMRCAATCLTLTALSLTGAAPVLAADEAGPPQPEAVVMTRTCEQNGALVVMNNLGGGSVTFNVLADNEASGTYAVSAGSQASHLVPIMEDQTVAIQVTADGMPPVAASRTRDCEVAAPAAADTTTAATDPVDAVPAGTPAPQPVQPTAVAGASDTPTDTNAAPNDTATAPSSSSAATVAPADVAPPSGTLPFTGAPSIGWLAAAGLALVGVGVLPLLAPRRDRRTNGVSAR